MARIFKQDLWSKEDGARQCVIVAIEAGFQTRTERRSRIASHHDARHYNFKWMSSRTRRGEAIRFLSPANWPSCTLDMARSYLTNKVARFPLAQSINHDNLSTKHAPRHADIKSVNYKAHWSLLVPRTILINQTQFIPVINSTRNANSKMLN